MKKTRIHTNEEGINTDLADRPIGIFDSGVGGLTVFREIENLLPKEDIIYFGDTARVPYGNKSESTIIKFSTQNILFLLEKKVKLIIIACNTASALALDYLRSIFSVPILGVIEAGVEKALRVTMKNKIAVIGTRSTIESGSYQRQLLNKNDKIKIYSKSCPLFVPLVEEGILAGNIAAEIIEMYLRDIKHNDVDSLILACTHYPLLKKAIIKYLEDIFIIDSAQEVAGHAEILLKEKGLLAISEDCGSKSFYVSDEPSHFIELAELFLKRKISQPEVINVG